MSEKVWKEYCEDCGCPLEICCKPKKPVVEVEQLEKWCNKNKCYPGFVDTKELLSAVHKIANAKIKGCKELKEELKKNEQM